MLIAYLPTSGIQKPRTIYQNSLDFTKFSLTKVSNLVYVIFKNIKMQKWRVRTSSQSVRIQTKIMIQTFPLVCVNLPNGAGSFPPQPFFSKQ